MGRVWRQEDKTEKCIVGSLVEVQAWQYNLKSWLTKTGKPSDRRRRGSRESSGSTQAYDGVASQFKVGFWNVEGLKSKVGSKDFLDVLCYHDIFGIAESWAGLEVYEIKGFNSYSKGRSKVAKFGRNPGGLVVYIREGISKRVTEIVTNMKEISVGVRKKRTSKTEMCKGLVYNAPQTS
jgi:hypothetical protein